jgi:hypothetical protein
MRQYDYKNIEKIRKRDHYGKDVSKRAYLSRKLFKSYFKRT